MHRNKTEKITKILFYSLLFATLVAVALANWNAIADAFAYNLGEIDNVTSLLIGLGNTMIVTLCAFVVGLLLGTVVCIVSGLESTHPAVVVLQQLTKIYVAVFRGTPAIVQLLIIYFIVFTTVSADYALAIAVLSFGLNSGAYVSEIVRGGINSVPRGQMEAGRSLGLSYPTVMTKIVLPQAVRNCLPSLGNEFITLIKETSVIGFIGAFDLTLAFRKLANATYDYTTVYLLMGLAYFVLVFGITKLFEILEKKVIGYARKQ